MSAQKSNKTQQNYEDLLQLYQAQKWQECLDLAPRIKQKISVLSEEDAAYFYFVCGQSHVNLEQYETAANLFNVIIREYPKFHYGVEGLIGITQVQKNWEQTVKLSVIFQKYFPQMWQGYWWLGVAYLELNQLDKAQEVFVAMQKDFSEQHQGFEGEILVVQRQANWQKMVQLSQQLVQKFPSFWQGYWYLGQSYKELQQLDLAEQNFAHLKQAFPQRHLGFEGELSVVQLKRNWNQLLDLSQNFVQKFPSFWQGYWFLGQAQKELQQFDLAQHQFAVLKEKFPERHQGFEGEIQVLQAQQNGQAMLECATVFQQKFPEMWQAYWFLGHAHNELQQFDLANHYFQMLKNQFPEKHQGFEALVVLARAQRDWVQAIDLVKEFTHQFPEVWQGYWWAGLVYQELKQWNLAEHYFSILRKKFPQYSQGFEGAISLAQNRQDWAQMLDLSRSFIQQFPAMWQGYWWLGSSAKQMQQYDLAEENFAYLRQHFAERHLGWEGTIQLAQERKEWRKVIELSKDFSQKFPHMWQGYYWFGHAHKWLREFDVAEQVFVDLQARFPERTEGVESLINLAQWQEDWQRATNLSLELKKQFPKKWQGYWLLACAYEKLGKKDLAEKEWYLLSTYFPEKFQELRQG